MTSRLSLFAWLVFLNALWAPVNLAVRFAREAGFSPLGLALARWIAVAALLNALVRLPAVRRRFGLRFPSRRDAWIAFGLGFAVTGPAHLFYYVAMGHTGSVEGTVFNTTSPFWTALFAAAILRERVGGLRAAALALGIAGAYVAALGFGPPHLASGHAAWNGLYLLGTIGESFTGVILAGVVRRSSGATALAWETLGMVAALALVGLAFPAALPVSVASSAVGWLALGYLIFGAGLFAFAAWATLIERTPISLMVVTLAVQPPIAALCAYWALGETLSPRVLAGALIVGVALGLAAREARSPEARAAELRPA